MTTRVFISYAKEDKGFAEKLNNDLSQAGVKTWIDSVDLLPGQRWEAVIERAISESSYVIVVLSSHSVGKKGYVQKEIRQAIEVAKEYPPNKIYIIPVRIDECEPSFKELRELQWTDLFPFREYEKGLEVLLRGFTYESEEEPALVAVDIGQKVGVIKAWGPGSIKKLTNKGFGFISPEGGPNDIFFHSNALVGVFFDELHEGDALSFDIEESPKGPVAVNVKKA